MIRCWRLCQDRFRDTAFGGEGARRYGGRWNPPGHPLIYTAQSLSLAALEILAHVDSDLVPGDFIRFEVRIPTSIAVESLVESDLPDGWQSEYPPLTTQAMGEDWLKRRTSAVLRVPSALIPGESNFLLNPLHEEFTTIEVAPALPFVFDRRLVLR